MKKILNFTEFINEASFGISDPAKAGQAFSEILGKTRNVRETPKGSNKGPEVEAYLKSVGLGPGNSWCQAYVYWALDQLSKKLGITNPAPKKGTVIGHWQEAPAENKITIEQARTNPTKVRPGMVFIKQRGDKPWSQGGWEGHTGIVLTINPDQKTFTSIEGNTDEQASGEGDKVGINTRKLDDKDMIGFIDWFKDKRTPEFESAIAGGGVKPELAGSAGTITGQFMIPTTAAPAQSTVGDRKAEEDALAKDQEEDQSIIASLLKPWRPGQASKSNVVTREEVKKFLGQPTYSEEYKKAHPSQD